MPETSNRPYTFVDFGKIAPVDCPCGKARRALAGDSRFPGTIHRTEILDTAKSHYHRHMTETYFVLDCEAGARIRLDDEEISVQRESCIVIPPGVVHQAIGRMSLLIIVLPEFDAEDEYLVD